MPKGLTLNYIVVALEVEDVLHSDITLLPPGELYWRHGTNIHGKPILFGYKFWSAPIRHGYLINCELYQGATGPTLIQQSDYGLGSTVLLELYSRLPENLGPYNRENRLKNCNLMAAKEIKKKPRGELVYMVSKEIIVAKWHDNSVVNMVSNCHRLSPITKMDRIDNHFPVKKYSSSTYHTTLRRQTDKGDFPFKEMRKTVRVDPPFAGTEKKMALKAYNL
ncbi:PiggyBac transposable element-derived protein 2 [Eumeta japonica]|uniref:PiggyBac transposable element-derived protein 2 n=1 Tax=Eumeta variegata TaxID=151549 RepID=A0A4C1XD23_EUMVA|nr:PiggyBac transposable element-derived protein 2 [Eumeta japonica]